METSLNVSDVARPANQRPPGPHGAWFGLLNLARLQQNPMGFAEKMAAHGDLSFAQLGPIAMYLAVHPDLVHDILVEQWEKFNKWSVQKKVMGQVVGNSSFNSDGEYWKSQRKLVQPAFHHRQVAGYAEIMVEETTRLIDSWQPGTEYDLLQGMFGLTMAIITRTVFGADIHGRERAVSQALTICLESEADQMVSPIHLPTWVPTPAHRRFKKAIRFFDDLMSEFIDARRQPTADGNERADLLSMLLASTGDEGSGPHLSNQEVRNEALTVFSAGHETSANALGWLWVELANHPEVETKLVEEINRVLGHRPPTLPDLRKLTYTDMVIKEVLRLHPPAWGFAREPNQPVVIGGWTIPKGSVIFLSPHVTHRDPRFWDRPLAFDPERFAEGWEKRVPRYAYFPFGGGPHVCTGQSMAAMELQISVAMFMQRCHFKLTPEQDFTPHLVVLQRPGLGIRATVQKRTSSAEEEQ